MRYATSMIGALALVLLSGACGREPGAEEARSVDADRTTELERQRSDDIARLSQRATEIERAYTTANQKVESGDRTATAGLREELKEDVVNIKRAVDDLGSTTPENWWERHEDAMTQTADDIGADVSRIAGKVTPVRPQETSERTGEEVSTAPFTSRRDRFVADLRARVDGMTQALETVRSQGAQETELEDVRARVKKLGEDVDRLRSATADEWWDVTKARVTEYLDRVEKSVDRLDDNRG